MAARLAGAVGYRDLVGAQLMATLFLGMIEPGKCGRHEHTGDQLLLVNADSAAKSGHRVLPGGRPV